MRKDGDINSILDRLDSLEKENKLLKEKVYGEENKETVKKVKNENSILLIPKAKGLSDVDSLLIYCKKVTSNTMPIAFTSFTMMAYCFALKFDGNPRSFIFYFSFFILYFLLGLLGGCGIRNANSKRLFENKLIKDLIVSKSGLFNYSYHLKLDAQETLDRLVQEKKISFISDVKSIGYKGSHEQ